MIEKDDWRLTGQEKFLMGTKLLYVSCYTPYSENWDHEHCCFCTSKISPYDGDLHEGYCTTDEKRMNWICKACYEDFKDMFQWVVVGNG